MRRILRISFGLLAVGAILGVTGCEGSEQRVDKENAKAPTLVMVPSQKDASANPK